MLGLPDLFNCLMNVSLCADHDHRLGHDNILGSSRCNLEKEMVKFPSGELCMPILPRINGDGTVNSIVFKGLRCRVFGIVMENPGMLEVSE